MLFTGDNLKKNVNFWFNLTLQILELQMRSSILENYSYNIVSCLKKALAVEVFKVFCERVGRNARWVRASGTKRIVKRRARDAGKRKISRVILATYVNVKRWRTRRGWRWFNNTHEPSNWRECDNKRCDVYECARWYDASLRGGFMWLLS